MVKIYPSELEAILGKVCYKHEVLWGYVSSTCYERVKRLAREVGLRVSSSPFGSPPGYVKVSPVLKRGRRTKPRPLYRAPRPVVGAPV